MKNCKHLLSVLLCLIFLSIVYLLLNRLLKFENFTVNHKYPLIEKWQDYKINPDGDNKPLSKYPYYSSGSDPMYLYRRDRYKKPLYYPLTYYKSYPVAHKTYGP